MDNATKDYIEAFNQGYELSKELGLKPEILKDVSAGNNRIEAMRQGMEQYGMELSKEKDIIPPLDFDSIETSYTDLEQPKKEKNKDLDMEL